ncbi:Piwi domain-containing protein [[Limnothrix rosea] IAM M-220]|uniref:Piwi domain-containing protein n=1 Tax=[Limnothrix rosea] IAM M-220 TaxID=454133 RepID=UPI0009590F0D|nr:Piwi domain-containing protein [[Limnothrix rosea] IAM M-220]OKH17363.1 hypothetical protein NIES208_09755 [[Limnothrix rosea] IAM M-220]
MSLTLFAEILPIDVTALPQLFTYQINFTGQADRNQVARKLQYRLLTAFRGYWVWSKSDQKIIADRKISQPQLHNALEQLWQDQNEDLFHRCIDSIQFSQNYLITNQGIADFVSQGLLRHHYARIVAILKQSQQQKNRYSINIVHQIYSWVVHSQPAISLSIKQEIDYGGTLASYLQKNPDIQNIKGLHVLDITKPSFNNAMEIKKVIGRLGEGNTRQRLLSQTRNPAMQEMIKEAPNQEVIVEVGNAGYHYISSALKIRVLNRDYERFGIRERLQIPSDERIKYLKPAMDFVQNLNYLQRAYNSRSNNCFIMPHQSWGHDLDLLFGSNHVIQASQASKKLQTIKNYGEYRKTGKEVISISILNCTGKDYSKNTGDSLNNLYRFRDALKKNFHPDVTKRRLPYKLKLVEQIDLNSKQCSRTEISQVVSKLAVNQPDIVLCLMPKGASYDITDRTLYDDLKQFFLQNNLQSQMIREETLYNFNYKLDNIILGVMAKVGSVPYILANPLEYTDLIVGLDVSRRRKKNNQGTNSVAAMTRIYTNQGELVHYSIRDAVIDGEILPEHILYDLFPAEEFGGKHILIHRDGLFPENERLTLDKIGAEIKARFNYVSVIKSGNPRLYGIRNQQVGKAPKGSIFQISDREAFVVSSEFPDGFKATPQPLRVETFDGFSLQHAVHSVLSLTYLHYGSERSPRLPVSTYYADKISTMASKGIKPRDPDGNLPFWL